MNEAQKNTIDQLAHTLVLGSLLDEVRVRWGAFEILDHWTQGEFHHDLVLRVSDTDRSRADLPGLVLVVATNCNGGVKEVLAFDQVPDRAGLWAMRCPNVEEFKAASPTTPLARSETLHWFDPCELLTKDARSELRPEFRVRQSGGGWTCATTTRKSSD